jgi:hypothetical protein
MRIRGEQLSQFMAAAKQNFESRMIAHVHQFYPEVCEELGEEAVRKQIHYGMKRAAFWGFEAEMDVCRYVDLTFMFGCDFDQDTECRWAKFRLPDRSYPDATAKMDDLFEAAAQSLDEMGA